MGDRRRASARCESYRNPPPREAAVGCNAMQPDATRCNPTQPKHPFWKNEPTAIIFEIASMPGDVARRGEGVLDSPDATIYPAGHFYEIRFQHR
jgi:hypothetical protein